MGAGCGVWGVGCRVLPIFRTFGEDFGVSFCRTLSRTLSRVDGKASTVRSAEPLVEPPRSIT
ncbi:hypothetical protein RVR34_19565 [Microcystis aeruginosa FBCC-A68]|uniref:hypothetical protein n=1 Tax=Microcystis aeruginosa TaxID=1126 RepID=UPI001116539B|nr:hypothetical protein [Microcystis aeruginosa]